MLSISRLDRYTHEILWLRHIHLFNPIWDKLRIYAQRSQSLHFTWISSGMWPTSASGIVGGTKKCGKYGTSDARECKKVSCDSVVYGHCHRPFIPLHSSNLSLIDIGRELKNFSATFSRNLGPLHHCHSECSPNLAPLTQLRPWQIKWWTLVMVSAWMRWCREKHFDFYAEINVQLLKISQLAESWTLKLGYYSVDRKLLASLGP